MNDRDSSPGRDSEGIFFLLATVSRPAPGPIQDPIQWVPTALSSGPNPRGVELTTHLHLVPMLMRGAIPPLFQGRGTLLTSEIALPLHLTKKRALA
jgi:hypothetical protein